MSTLWEHAFTLDLLTHEGRCRGALVWSEDAGQSLVWGKQTILCTGGAGQIYRETTNPEVATGDGHAIAYRAGAELRDMEFMQFHPTVLYIAGSSRSLITEAMRGEGAQLVDRNGHRFMPEYDPRAELAPRRCRQPGDRHADGTHAASERLSRPLASRPRHGPRPFPGIAATCAEFALDITQDRIPVRPGAPLYDRRRDRRPRRAARRCRASGRRANAPPAACTARIAWPRTACSKGWCSGPMPAKRPPAQRPTCRTIFMPCRFRIDEVDNGVELLDLADIRNSLKSVVWRGAGVRRERGFAGRSGRERRPLVRICAGPAV